ncbi:MAG: hypothetical protein V5B78_01305 [Desulfohalobiaceae bacterium]
MALLIAEDGSGACYFVSGFQGRLHGIDWSFRTVFRSDNQPAALIRTPQNNERSRPYAFIHGKALDCFMDDISMFQAQDKDSAVVNLFRIHGFAPGFFYNPHARWKPGTTKHEKLLDETCGVFVIVTVLKDKR